MASALIQIQDKRRPWQFAVVDRVQAIVGALWPEGASSPHMAWVELYGSLATGLDSPCSDIDVIVRGVPAEQSWGTSSGAHERLTAALCAEAWVESAKVIPSLPVSIIKVQGAAVTSGGGLISLDISFECPSHRGLNTATYVRYLLSREPNLRPLSLVVKQLLVEKGLNDPYSGGLSSYGLTLLLAFTLNRRRRRRQRQHCHTDGNSGGVTGDHNARSRGQMGGEVVEEAGALEGQAQEEEEAECEQLGMALLEFLQFFGEKFDPRTQGISVRKGECYTLPLPRANSMSSTAGNEIRPMEAAAVATTSSGAGSGGSGISAPQRDPLVIEEPTNPFNNVGRTCFGVSELQWVLSAAFSAVHTSAAARGGGDGGGVGAGASSVLGHMFGAAHHRSVVKLVRQVWCPPERPGSQASLALDGAATGVKAVASTPVARVDAVRPVASAAVSVATKSVGETGSLSSPSSFWADHASCEEWSKAAYDLLARFEVGAMQHQRSSSSSDGSGSGRSVCPCCGCVLPGAHDLPNCELSQLLKTFRGGEQPFEGSLHHSRPSTATARATTVVEGTVTPHYGSVTRGRGGNGAGGGSTGINAPITTASALVTASVPVATTANSPTTSCMEGEVVATTSANPVYCWEWVPATVATSLCPTQL